jgi:hypothetical protein
MQRGSFSKNEYSHDEYIEQNDEEAWEESLGAFGKGATQCYACGGFGHMARECPSKGKGKSAHGPYGKSKGKGDFGGKGFTGKGEFGKGAGGKSFGGKTFGGDQKGKGKGGFKGEGKGPAQGCWNCGGAHKAANCPNSGKGGNVRHVEESSENEWTPMIRSLCGLSTHIEEAWTKVGKTTQGQTKILKRNAKKVRFEDENKWKILEDENKDEEKTVCNDQHALETVSDPKSVASAKPRNVKKVRLDERQKHNFQGKGNALETVSDPISVAASRSEVSGSIKNSNNELRIFQTIIPEGVNAVKTRDEWECIELAVDSGATETVVGEDMLTDIETKEGWASKHGVQYEVANGERIPNVGEKKFQGITEHGLARNITAQVCDVNKALLSVKKIIAAGNRVTFDEEG